MFITAQEAWEIIFSILLLLLKNENENVHLALIEHKVQIYYISDFKLKSHGYGIDLEQIEYV